MAWYTTSVTISYEALSPSYKSFVASLQSIAIPTDWRAAKRDQKWFVAMKEELDALRKNKTWELTTLPRGKKAVIGLYSKTYP
jgi:hypothetical protein